MKNALIKKTALLLFTLAITFASSAVLNAESGKFIEKSFSVNPGETLDLSVSPGDVIIKGWDKKAALIKVFGNRKAEKEIRYTIERTERGVLVKTDREKISWDFWNNTKLKFEIRIPHEFTLKIKTAGGDIQISGVSGSGDIKTSGGDIDLNENSGELNCSTSGGDININKHQGNIKLSTSGGDIEIRKVTGDVNAVTSGGDIYLETANGEAFAKTSGGDIQARIRGEFKGAKLLTSGGDIEVVLQENVNADLELKTSGGGVDVNAKNAKPTLEKSNKYEGVINSGGNLLLCKTSGGDITLSTR